MGGVRTIILLGCTGNGKSATGNSILGCKAFKSMSRFRGVTTTCQLSSTVLQDGQILNVIDTPGLFDSSTSPQDIEKEIVRCVQLAKDGIHVILIVVSLRVRFSKEQVAIVDTLKHLFGTRILDYMIVAFTDGDQLEYDETLDDHLASCPKALKELLEKCGNRRVIFDNKAKDESKKAEQLHQLLTLINDIMEKNGGKPYTRDLILEFKNEDTKAYNEEQMQQLIAETVHKKLKDRNEEIITQLEKDFEKLQKRNEELIDKLKEDLQSEQRQDYKRRKAKEKERNLKREIRELEKELERAKREIERRPRLPCPLM